MARTLTESFKTASVAGLVRAAILSEFSFDEGTLRFWAGVGDLIWNGNVFHGSGVLLNVSPPEEIQSLESTSCVWELSGIPESVVAAALTSDYSGRPCRFWLALFDGDWQIINDPVPMFSGTMDVMPILDDPNKPIIRLSAENDLNKLTRPRERRWTHEEQQIDYPGDLFFEFVSQMQDREIIWQ